MLEAGSCLEGRLSPTERGTPQGGVISPVLSNILLTPFDWEMRARGYQLTRYADDWVVTCTSEAEAAPAAEPEVEAEEPAAAAEPEAEAAAEPESTEESTETVTDTQEEQE